MAGCRLPSSMADWVRHGACAHEDPEIFWPSTGPNGDARAREICGRCTVRSQCRAWAFANNPSGFWGGMSESERRAAKRRRKQAAAAATAAVPSQSGGGSYAERSHRADCADRVDLDCEPVCSGIGS